MSKYIRTKDGACAVNDEKYNIKYIIPAEDYLKKYYFDCKYVIAQADTIEELCDTYVFVGKDKDENGNPILWNIKQDIPFLMKYYLKNNLIYGAIWTDKGLIYVAKLNDKGELELI